MIEASQPLDTNISTIARLLRYAQPHRNNRAKRFAEISKVNSEVVDELLLEIRRLIKNKRHAEADRLIAIAQRITDNNKRFQDMVGEVLSDDR